LPVPAIRVTMRRWDEQGHPIRNRPAPAGALGRVSRSSWPL
jgi:hypothetical protein